jgi:hypothetical protein
MSSSTETSAFAARLKSALDAAGVRTSPTVIAHEFNLRFWGRSITPHTARNWLLGNSLPTQDKLRVLAEWLQVAPDELRFGRGPGKLRAQEGDALMDDLNLADREMVTRYLSLAPNARRTARDVVIALAAAANLDPAGEATGGPPTPKINPK